MIFNLPNVRFTDEEWIYILSVVLKGWTEIPLSTIGGYNQDNLKFYDGIIGLLIKQTEDIKIRYPSALNHEFVDSWMYQGKLYRVLHPSIFEDENSEDGYSSKLPEVEYHEMLTHWTSDYTFEALMYKLSPNETYIILEADTKEHLAFDVNCFREAYDITERYTAKEREIIFPMYKEYIVEYRTTIEKFIEMKRKEEV